MLQNIFVGSHTEHTPGVWRCSLANIFSFTTANFIFLFLIQASVRIKRWDSGKQALRRTVNQATKHFLALQRDPTIAHVVLLLPLLPMGRRLQGRLGLLAQCLVDPVEDYDISRQVPLQ
jgi:hypothetical protein